MEATVELLGSKQLWEIKISDIAAKAKLKGPNFYAYFNSVEDVILALSDQATEDLPDMASVIDCDWEIYGGRECARRIALMSIEYWEKHRSVLRIVNMLADDGQPKFLRARIARLAPTYRAFRRRIEAAQAAGRMGAEFAPRLAAYSLAVQLEHWGHNYNLTRREFSQEQVLETLSGLLFGWLSGLKLFPSHEPRRP